jgi:predicted nucleic acid-binding protein
MQIAVALPDDLAAPLLPSGQEPARAGRTEAERHHLHVTGIVGVQADAHLAGLLDFNQSLIRLRATNFRLSAEVEV